MNYSTILIATDGSKCSMHAVKKGIGLAKDLSADIVMLYVVDMNAIMKSIDATPEKNYDANNIEVLLKKKIADLFDEISNTYAYAKITKISVEGDPKEAINIIAEEQKVDLIIMGTHGRTGIKRLLMGSVAEHVLRYSKIPVMVVSSHEE